VPRRFVNAGGALMMAFINFEHNCKPTLARKAMAAFHFEPHCSSSVILRANQRLYGFAGRFLFITTPITNMIVSWAFLTTDSLP
jgi:hypothetical protein